MAAGRRCLDCPRIIPTGSYRGRCRDCLRAWDQARGTPTDRGYGATVLPSPLGTMTYAAAKGAYQAMLDDGAELHCACGCGDLVDGTTRSSWHLGHDDERTKIVGPMKPSCNLSDAGRASAYLRGSA